MSPVQRSSAAPRQRPADHAARTVPAAAASVPEPAHLGIDRWARARRTCLQLPDDLPLTAWLRVGQQLMSVRDSSAWWAGDWLVYGSERYPHRYREAIERTGLDHQTLRNYAWVARKFPVPRRRPQLSFQHHQEVAALAPDQQNLWLDRSIEYGWSKAELRRRLRANAPGRDAPGGRGTRLSLEVGEERWAVWRRAAQREDKDVAEWLTSLADRAAHGDPGHGT
ncbi:LmbU family transcriptional regulator [Streptomyces sp. NPDC086519]|uniref:LmbU family transcriptional regulator n=1 Tax=Streptomyces sp. NPDC086519 TaxID=3154863 RepID=UPI00343A838D